MEGEGTGYKLLLQVLDNVLETGVLVVAKLVEDERSVKEDKMLETVVQRN
jgi:hypothetical protein